MDSIRELLEQIEKDFDKMPAIKWPQGKDIQQKTYKELVNSASLIRRALGLQGLDNDHIAIVGFSSIEWITSFFAITSGNNSAVLIDPLLPSEEIIDLLIRSDSKAVFLDPSKMDLEKDIDENCPGIRKIFYLSNEQLDALEKTGENAPEIEGNTGDKLAMIIFTSGTTGKSKGVMLSQKNLLSNVEAVEYDTCPGKVTLSVLPIHHAYCLVMDYLKCLSLGSTVCINDSFLHMVKNMQLFKPNVMLMVPMMIETIYKKLSSAGKLLSKKVIAAKVFGGNLTTIFSGGAHLDPFYVEKFKEYGVDIYEGYGMSECSPVISSNTPANYRPGSVGKVLKNAEVKFVNGEILVKSSSVMMGYYDMPKETAETLEGGYLHTGDKGYMDDDGYLYINGRIKNLIILSNGENISPEEIENKLSLYPLIDEVIVVGDEKGLTAKIYPDQDIIAKKKMNSEKVEKELQTILDEYNRSQPTYRRIVHLVVRENPFIRNTTKKILRQYA